MQYKVLVENKQTRSVRVEDTLEAKVEDHLKRGWKLLGGVSIAHTKIIQWDNGCEELYALAYAQAMILED